MNVRTQVIQVRLGPSLESVEWNDGMEHWNGILELPKLYLKLT